MVAVMACRAPFSGEIMARKGREQCQRGTRSERTPPPEEVCVKAGEKERNPCVSKPLGIALVFVIWMHMFDFNIPLWP